MAPFCFIKRAAIVLAILFLIGWLFPREAFAEPTHETIWTDSGQKRMLETIS